MNSSKLLGIVTCLGMIGYCVYALIDPMGFARRFSKKPLAAENPAAIRGVIIVQRIGAGLMILAALYFLLDILGWI
jgi:hypothetical protein